VPRTIERVNRDFSTATRLNSERKELASHCQEIADQHLELLKLSDSPEIRHSRDWLGEARLTAQRAGAYAAENWPRSDAVIALDGDLQDLDKSLDRLVFANPGEPLPEKALAGRLEETRQLVQSYQALRGCVNNIQKRLAQIQDTERDTREALKGVEAELTQISYVVGSNAYLDKAASRDMERYEDHLGRLINELNTRERDMIEKKAKKVELLASKIYSSTSKWLNQITKETNDQTQAIATSITTLDGIAVIDEKPIYDARQLLSSANMNNGPLNKSAPSGELIQELKKRSDFWQECSAVSQAVEDIEAPVTESYALASQNRQHAQDEHADLTNWMRQTRDWPPTTVSLESEELELKNLETQWKAGKGAATKAITLVQKLSNLAGKYRMLGDRIHLAGERLSEEQQGVEELEIELDETMQSWQDQWRSHRSSPLAGQEIDELLSDAESEYKKIKNDYKGGKKGYDDVVQALKLLHRRVRLAQIAVDDTHVIDINGREIAYRE
jgi:chromosome segregation ATPase